MSYKELILPDVFINHFGDCGADGKCAISPSELSVMTSMINVGELVGSVSAAPLNDYLGRKGVFMTGALTIIVGIILQLATSSNRALMTAGRAILGYGVGNFSATSPLYMGVGILLRLYSQSRHLTRSRNLRQTPCVVLFLCAGNSRSPFLKSLPPASTVV